MDWYSFDLAALSISHFPSSYFICNRKQSITMAALSVYRIDPSDRPQVPIPSPTPGQLSKARPKTKRLGSYSGTGGTPRLTVPFPKPTQFPRAKGAVSLARSLSENPPFCSFLLYPVPQERLLPDSSQSHRCLFVISQTNTCIPPPPPFYQKLRSSSETNSPIQLDIRGHQPFIP
ncbi:hypothetical protein LZ31DRAFT_154564 [Colletotrichum somersetense]|nr:hypothetical protein LZ31DRAFT_154564 [Colletotrichum somersetense]